MFDCFRSGYDLLALFATVYKQSSREFSGELLWGLRKLEVFCMRTVVFVCTGAALILKRHKGMAD